MPVRRWPIADGIRQVEAATILSAPACSRIGPTGTGPRLEQVDDALRFWGEMGQRREALYRREDPARGAMPARRPRCRSPFWPKKWRRVTRSLFVKDRIGAHWIVTASSRFRTRLATDAYAAKSTGLRLGSAGESPSLSNALAFVGSEAK